MTVTYKVCRGGKYARGEKLIPLHFNFRRVSEEFEQRLWISVLTQVLGYLNSCIPISMKNFPVEKMTSLPLALLDRLGEISSCFSSVDTIFMLLLLAPDFSERKVRTMRGLGSSESDFLVSLLFASSDVSSSWLMTGASSVCMIAKVDTQASLYARLYEARGRLKIFFGLFTLFTSSYLRFWRTSPWHCDENRMMRLEDLLFKLHKFHGW